MGSIFSLLQREPEFGCQIEQLVVQTFKANPTQDESASFSKLRNALSSTAGRELIGPEAEYLAVESSLIRCRSLQTLVLSESSPSHWWLLVKEGASHSLS